MFGKKSVAFLLILSITAAIFYAPIYTPVPPQKAEALFGFTFTVDVKALIRSVVDGIAMVLAQVLVDRMIKSTIDWAQSGFEGNPAYVVDPKQYFSDIADGVAGKFIAGSDLNFLCSPFQTQIRLALIKNYGEPEPFQCTLTDVVGNIEAFYGDFSQGGWDGWFSMTQNSDNNPYGAFLSAQARLDARLTEAQEREVGELNRNQGFLDWAPCIANEFAGFNPDGTPIKGRCIERDKTKTPGGIIKSGLDKALPAPIEKLVSVTHIEQLLSAFMTGLLQRYVFGSNGLFNRDASPIGPPPGPPPTPPGSGGCSGTQALDIDGDGNVDGLDTNCDGTLDICYFGGLGNDLTGPPCKGSVDGLEPPSPPPTPPGPGGVGGSCQNVTRAGVEAITNKYQPNDAGMNQALPELRTAYGSQVSIFGDPNDAIDKINFGGGMTVDVISNAGGPNAAWGWILLTACGSGGGSPPASLQSQLTAEKAKYSASDLATCDKTTSEEPPTCPMGAILNAVAWNNRALGWGLNSKTGGHRCPSPAGLIACDILHHQPTNALYDVFSWPKVTWHNIGPNANSSRPWVAPVQPPGSAASAGGLVDLSTATIVNAPTDVASWPETTQITSVDFSGNWTIAFDKKDGPNRWPDQYGGPGIAPTDTIQYTVWLFLDVGQWVGSAFIQSWYGRNADGGPGDPYVQLPQNWYYGSAWAPMTGHVLRPGEQIGFMVTSGNSRNGGVPLFKERSNVVLVTL